MDMTIILALVNKAIKSMGLDSSMGLGELNTEDYDDPTIEFKKAGYFFYPAKIDITVPSISMVNKRPRTVIGDGFRLFRVMYESATRNNPEEQYEVELEEQPNLISLMNTMVSDWMRYLIDNTLGVELEVLQYKEEEKLVEDAKKEGIL